MEINCNITIKQETPEFETDKVKDFQVIMIKSEVDSEETCAVDPFTNDFSSLINVKTEIVKNERYEIELSNVKEESCNVSVKDEVIDREQLDDFEDFKTEICYDALNVDQNLENFKEFSPSNNVVENTDTSECNNDSKNYRSLTQTESLEDIGLSQHEKKVTEKKCKICNKSFKRKHSLDYHVLKQHKNETLNCNIKDLITTKILTCNDCNYETTTKFDLDNHMVAKHNKEKIKINCHLCDKSFTRTHGLNDHMITQHATEVIKSKIHKCTSCPYQTKIRGYFYKHINGVHNQVKPEIKCELCRKLFSRNSALNVHMRNYHKPDGIKSEVYKCKLCSYSSKIPEYLTKHVKATHNQNRPKFACEVCGKEFLTKHAINDHMLKQHNKKVDGNIYECHICSYQSTRKLNFDTHIATHDKHRQKRVKLICQFCDKPFASKYTLHYHMLQQHPDEMSKGNMINLITSKVHSCSMCSYKTVSKGELTSHINSVHFNKQDIKCEMCDKSFKRKVDLNDHLLKQHNQQTESKIHKCTSCPFQTTIKSCLDKHNNALHNEQRTKLNCNFCDKIFKAKHSLNDHMLKHHETEILEHDIKGVITSKTHVCDICGYATTKKSNLHRHKISVHNQENVKSLTQTESLEDIGLSQHEKKVTEKKCKICNKSFKRKHSLDYHVLKQHKNETLNCNIKDLITTKILTCNDCNYETTTKFDLDNHMVAKHNKEKIKINCHLCDKSFTRTHGLNDHMITQHATEVIKSKIHKCTSCPYQTKIRGYFYKHINGVHNQVKPEIKCELCRKLFSRNSALNVHMRNYHKPDGIKSEVYKCKLCSYSSKIPEYLTKHVKATHNQNRPKFACEVCGKEFLTKHAINDHMLKQHNKKVDGNIYECHICSYQSTRKLNFDTHIATHDKHRQKRVKLICQFCDKPFASKYTLHYHMLQQHPDEMSKGNMINLITSKVHSCSMCSYKTVSKGELTSPYRFKFSVS